MFRKKIEPWLPWLPAMAWTLLIIILSLTSDRSIPSIHIPHLDKVAHALVYAAFSFWWLYGMRLGVASHWRNSTKNQVILLSAIALGTVLEMLQYYVAEDRTFEMLDNLANIIGSLLGIVGFRLLNEKPAT